MSFQVGNKVTICRRNYRGDSPISITTVTSISPRLVKTADGSRWQPKWGYALAPDGRVMKTKSIRLSKEGDERAINRLALAEAAAPLLSPTYPHLSPLENLGVLSDADLETLADISKRYTEALKRHLESKNDAEQATSVGEEEVSSDE